MHIDRILEDFTHTDGLPKAAIRAARVERDTVTPVFLDCLSKGAESEAELDDNDRALFFVIFLLAEFREQRAFPPLMKLLGREGERVDGILGDAITECLPQLVLSVFDGDMDPIRQLIENVEADEFVRDAMFDVLTALVLTGRLDREWIKSFLLRCYAELEPQKDSHVWIGWYQAIAALGLVELHGLVRKAYDNGFISHRYAHWHHIEGDLKEPVSDEGRDAWLEGHRVFPLKTRSRS